MQIKQSLLRKLQKVSHKAIDYKTKETINIDNIIFPDKYYNEVVISKNVKDVDTGLIKAYFKHVFQYARNIDDSIIFKVEVHDEVYFVVVSFFNIDGDKELSIALHKATILKSTKSEGYTFRLVTEDVIAFNDITHAVYHIKSLVDGNQTF